MLLDIFWTSGEAIGRIAITAVVGYALLVACIRGFGTRTTSRMNNFDWIVTVAVGSTFASTVVLKSVSVADGLTAIVTLLCLQFAMTYATSHWQWARSLLIAPSRVLYRDNTYNEAEMLRARVSHDEIEAAVRNSGSGSLDDVLAVVLESDAQLAVVKTPAEGEPEILDGVR